MDLFVVNRHVNESLNISTENNDEREKLDKLLKRIDRNKLKRQKQRERIKIEKKNRKAHKTASQLEPSEIEDKELKSTNFKAEQQKVVKMDSLEGFTVLGADSLGKKNKVKRVLPKWLLNPTTISSNLQQLSKKISDIKQLDYNIKNVLKSQGIEYFFPVQAVVIPWLLDANKHSDVVFPRDICVSAPTGSGKSLAFVLPIVQALKKHQYFKRIRALVILPTQDLALQIFKTFKTYTQNTLIDVCLISGNNAFENEQKQLIVENKVFGNLSKADILICTGGRLVDHLKQTKGFDLHYLEFLVIDEADRVLDNVQNDWLYHLEGHIHNHNRRRNDLNLFTLQKQRRRPPQKLLFSATLSQDPEKLNKLSLFQPKLFTSIVYENEQEKDSSEQFIGKYTTPKELTEKYIICSSNLKPLVLFKFIKNEKLTKTLIFTHSIESNHRLTILLKSLFNDQMKIEEISSNKKNRNNLIAKLVNGEIDILVSTDSLARGIDLPGVKCVISYSAPKYLKTYIHRAGRTARAGEQGLAITLLQKEQYSNFQTLLKQAEKQIIELKVPENDLEPLSEQYKQALSELKKVVELEEKHVLKKIKFAKRKVKIKKICD